MYSQAFSNSLPCPSRDYLVAGGRFFRVLLLSVNWEDNKPELCIRLTLYDHFLSSNIGHPDSGITREIVP